MNDGGRLVLRLALGVLVLLHGISKLRGGVGPIADIVAGAGLPPFVTYGVYVGEVVAPLMVIAGWFARAGAAIIAVNMVFAVALAHRADLLALGRAGGYALELQAMYLAAAIAVAMLGPGRFGVNGR